MLVKIQTHFFEDGVAYEPSQKPVDVREAKAQQWIKNGWAFPMPIERAIIETPEAKSEIPKRETAVMKNKAEEKKQ